RVQMSERLRMPANYPARPIADDEPRTTPLDRERLRHRAEWRAANDAPGPLQDRARLDVAAVLRAEAFQCLDDQLRSGIAVQPRLDPGCSGIGDLLCVHYQPPRSGPSLSGHALMMR